jgi:hypothetical protein
MMEGVCLNSKTARFSPYFFTSATILWYDSAYLQKKITILIQLPASCLQRQHDPLQMFEGIH